MMKTIILFFTTFIAFIVISCTGADNHNKNIKSTSALSTIVHFTGTDSNDQTVYGVEGELVYINFTIDLSHIDEPDGTEFIITPEFIKKDTDKPWLYWKFNNNKLWEPLIIKKGEQTIYKERLMVMALDSKSQYYNNFTASAVITKKGETIGIRSQSSAEVSIFGIMNQIAIGKVYLGDYDYKQNKYTLSNMIGLPMIRDDGHMLLNKLVINNDPILFPHGLQEIMITAYKGSHQEEVLKQPYVAPSCPNDNYKLIGTKITGISNNVPQDTAEHDIWYYVSPVIGKQECTNGDNVISNLFYLSKGVIHKFDSSINKVTHISSDGIFVTVNNNAVYNLNTYLKRELYNADGSAFIKDSNYIQELADNGIVLAYDIRKNETTNQTNNDWIICSATVKNCSIIPQLHSDSLPLPNTATMSKNGAEIYAIINKNGNNMLMHFNRSSGKAPVNIVVPNINLNKVTISHMSTTNQGLLMLQYEDSSVKPLVRTTVFYSYKYDKWISAPSLFKYLGLSNYLVNGMFHGFIGISPNGKSIGLYITDLNDDQFNEEKIPVTAVMSYSFGNGYLPDYPSFDELIKIL